MFPCWGAQHQDIGVYVGKKDCKSVSSSQLCTKIMTIRISRKARAATLDKVKPLATVKVEGLVKQQQQVTKQLPGYIICQLLLPAEREIIFPLQQPVHLKEKTKSHVLNHQCSLT